MPLSDKQIAALKDKNTYVLIPENGPESQLAQQFLEANAPSVIAEERVFYELHLLSLHANLNMLAVFRSPKRPCMDYTHGPDGVLRNKLRPVKELMDEMLITQPVTPKFHKEAPMKPLVMDLPKFLEDMANELVPKGIRLDYVDKGESRPQILKLTWV